LRTHTRLLRDEAVLGIERRRFGLDEARSWAIVSEVNRFVWPSLDLRPVTRVTPSASSTGLLPPSLLRHIRDGLGDRCSSAAALDSATRE